MCPVAPMTTTRLIPASPFQLVAQFGQDAVVIGELRLIGGALGLAIFSAIATARTAHLLASGTAPAAALDAGFHQALTAAAVFLLAAALVALRTTSSRGEPATAEPAAVLQTAAGDAAVRVTER